MNDETIIAEVVDIAEILKLVPHRYPFLMVDRVTNLRGDEFGIVLADSDDDDRPRALAQEILDRMRQPFRIDIVP